MYMRLTEYDWGRLDYLVTILGDAHRAQLPAASWASSSSAEAYVIRRS